MSRDMSTTPPVRWRCTSPRATGMTLAQPGLDVILGTSGVDPPAQDHVTFSCELRAIGAMAIDAPATLSHASDLLGVVLTRARVRATSGPAPELPISYPGVLCRSSGKRGAPGSGNRYAHRAGRSWLGHRCDRRRRPRQITESCAASHRSWSRPTEGARGAVRRASLHGARQYLAGGVTVRQVETARGLVKSLGRVRRR
jgi:hypothetical protein